MVTANMNRDQIDIFNQSESYSMLRSAQKLVLNMRRPDLEYMLVNTFEDLIQKDFFTCQELLLGKSICDICLNTPKYIAQALKTWKPDEDNMFINKTSMYQLIAGD